MGVVGDVSRDGSVVVAVVMMVVLWAERNFGVVRNGDELTRVIIDRIILPLVDIA